MSPEEEAHWRYQLELMTNWGHDRNRVNFDFMQKLPEEVRWLREEARYKVHLANTHARRQHEGDLP